MDRGLHVRKKIIANRTARVVRTRAQRNRQITLGIAEQKKRKNGLRVYTLPWLSKKSPPKKNLHVRAAGNHLWNFFFWANSRGVNSCWFMERDENFSQLLFYKQTFRCEEACLLR